MEPTTASSPTLFALPRLLISAAASGAGKTSVAAGLMAALRQRGHDVAGFKTGPDFIDPSYHALATGRPGRNLDPFLSGPQRIAPLFAHGGQGASIAVIEGAMGLFDGVRPELAHELRQADWADASDAGRSGISSSAHVARLLAAPVVLVIDAAGMSSSIAALARGMADFDPRITVAGVIANRVAGQRHRDLLASALEQVGIPLLGALGRGAIPALPSRHLGLVPAAERSIAAQRDIGLLADAIASACDLDALERLARTAPALRTRPWSACDAVATAAQASLDTTSAVIDQVKTAEPVPIGIAGGAAFTLCYPEHRELLVAAGAQLVDLDMTRNEPLPGGITGLYLPGGFPEVHAAALEASPMRTDIARAVANGVPVVAECAGLLYLGNTLDGRAMSGVLDITGAMGSRLILGYRRVRCATTNLVAEAGEMFHGHEFHRVTTDRAAGHRPAWRATTSTADEGFAERAVHASFLHLHWSGSPQIATRLVAAARAQRASQHVHPRMRPTGIQTTASKVFGS